MSTSHTCALKGRAVKTWKSERKYNRVYAQHRLIYRIENMWPITKNVARMSQSCSTCCTYQFCGALALHLCLSLFHAGVHVGRSVVHIAVLGNFHPVSFSFCHQHNISFHFIYLFISHSMMRLYFSTRAISRLSSSSVKSGPALR